MKFPLKYHFINIKKSIQQYKISPLTIIYDYFSIKTLIKIIHKNNYIDKKILKTAITINVFITHINNSEVFHMCEYIYFNDSPNYIM